MSVLEAGSSLNDEERKMCARFEDYVEKIRKRELCFTLEADLDRVNDPETKEQVPLPTYVGRCMARYDRQKSDETDQRNMLVVEDDESFVARFSLLRSAEKLRFLIARNALGVIDEALASPTPLIVEGEAFFSKLEECEKGRKTLADERDQSNAELEKVSAELIALQAKYEECQRRLHIRPLGDKQQPE